MFSRQAKVIRDAKGRRINTTARGYQVLRDPALNKGTAFSAAERSALGLDGLLPPVVTTELEPQLERAYAAYRAAPTDLAQHIYMWRLHDNNVTLFYGLLQRHMLENVTAATKLFPSAMLHWEDFGSTNARRILGWYRDKVPTFNDDMQGTGAIVLAGLLNAVARTGVSWTEQRVVVFGAGTAGVGIADQIRDQMVRHGLSKEDATRRIWLVDLPGLLTADITDGLLDYQRPYARPSEEVAGLVRTPCAPIAAAETRWPAMSALRTAAATKSGIIDLATTVAAAKPTILIGTSTTPQQFTKEIVRTMASHVEHPIIFPLSNPTELHEATPAQLIEWTEGKVLVATGAPFDNIEYGGVIYRIGQANNAALYPGLGFGVIVSRAAKVSDEMIFASAQAVASQATDTARGASLLPSNADLRMTSSTVAVEVGRTAIAQGLARASIDDLVEAVRSAQWWPVYCPVEAV